MQEAGSMSQDKGYILVLASYLLFLASCAADASGDIHMHRMHPMMFTRKQMSNKCFFRTGILGTGL